jgi:hypothetical protein
MGDVDSFGHGIADFKALNDSIFMMSLVKILMALALYALIIGLIIFCVRSILKRRKGAK